MSVVAIDGLGFRFDGSSHWALRDVNLAIEPGEFVVVMGPSGCGKSTLALAIGGYLFRQYSGEATGRVTVAGMDVRDRPIYDVAEAVGLVQQSPEAQFCTLTVWEEVAFGLENRCLPREEIRERLAWALGIVGAGHLSERPLASLSGGEKQKVAIAAMMAARPQVLILDEPTSNLDPTATAEVFRVISQLRDQAGITVIVIEHKVGYLLPFAPRLIGMEAGRVTSDGPASPARLPVLPKDQQSLPAPSAGSEQPLVRAQGLTLGYGGPPVVQDVSLDIHPGEFVAVMGDNGSGKTTFLHSLIGLLKPTHGSLEVFRHDTRRTSVSHLARRVGLLFQNPDHQFFCETVWQEAVFALENWRLLDPPARERARDLLTRCGLGGRLSDHPYRLSYGEKRRLSLVAVLTYEPQLILLDEVLIGQDAANAGLLLGLLCERRRRGIAVVMVSHDPEVTRRYATRLVFFEAGRVLVDEPVDAGLERLAAFGYEAYRPTGGPWR